MKSLLLLATILVLIGGSASAADESSATERTSSPKASAPSYFWIDGLDFGIPSKCSTTTREASAPKRINVAFTKRGMRITTGYSGSCSAPGVGVLRSAQNAEQQPQHFIKVVEGDC